MQDHDTVFLNFWSFPSFLWMNLDPINKGYFSLVFTFLDATFFGLIAILQEGQNHIKRVKLSTLMAQNLVKKVSKLNLMDVKTNNLFSRCQRVSLSQLLAAHGNTRTTHPLTLFRSRLFYAILSEGIIRLSLLKNHPQTTRQ